VNSCRIMSIAAALASVPAAVAPAVAEPLFSLIDASPSYQYSATPPIGAWQTTVVRAPAVAARDPGWTASVAALAPSRLTTGSVARMEPHPLLPGPRLTGNGHALSGQASFYSEEQMTATGERFDKRAMTAAHKTLPFGTRVRVTRTDTGNSVVVRINDRGPYKPGRIIDLSERAAETLGMTSSGVSPVRLEVLGQ
jgi:rare lipoprotein A